MDREEFKNLFLNALEIATQNAERYLSINMPRQFMIEFFGLYRSGDMIDIETAIDRMYLGKGLFYPIIDVMVTSVTTEKTIVRIVVSGFPPKTKFEDTLNDPPGSGPFKQMISVQITIS